jgi:hypothetical protein
MSRLIDLIDEIKQKITDNEYKLIVEELSTHRLSQVKIAIPWIYKPLNTDEQCDDNPLILSHTFITLVIPTKYIEDNNISECNEYILEDLFTNSLNYDHKSFINEYVNIIDIGQVHIHNKSCIVLSTKII